MSAISYLKVILIAVPAKMARAAWRGTLSPSFKYNILIPKLDDSVQRDACYNWKLLALKLMPHFHQDDIDKIKVYARCSRKSPVEVMLQVYEAYVGEVDGYELCQALNDIGRHDIVKYMEDNYANVFVDPNKPTDYQLFCEENVSKQASYKMTESAGCPPLPNCKHSRSAPVSGMDIEQSRGATASPKMMDSEESLGAMAAPQMEFEQSIGARASPQLDFEHPLGAAQADPQEVSFYTEHSLEMDSESVFHGSYYLPVPLRGAFTRLGFRKSGRKKHQYQNSTAHSASTRSSEDTVNESIVVDENSSQFENFNGVIRGGQAGEGSMEVEARSRNGQPSVLGSDWQENISAVVGISFTEQDRALAERLAYHLKFYGCVGVLIDKGQVSKLHQLDAIIVVYSFHYKEQVYKPTTFWRKNHIRSVFDFLTKEFSRNRENQRCILYPTFLLVGQRIPSMFHDHCPRNRKAMQVYRVLFRRQGHH